MRLNLYVATCSLAFYVTEASRLNQQPQTFSLAHGYEDEFAYDLA